MITPIPIRPVNSRMELYRLQPIPFVIPQMTNLTVQTRDLVDECLQYGQFRFCPHMVKRKSTIMDSCEVAIFRNQLEKGHEFCHIKFMEMHENAIQLNLYEFLLYWGQQALRFVCKYGNGTE